MYNLTQNQQFHDFFYHVQDIHPELFTTVSKEANSTFLVPEESIYFLVDGTVAQYYHYNNGVITNPFRMHHFDLLGVYEMFYAIQPTVKYRTATRCVLLEMNRQLFMTMAQDQKELYQRVLIHLINRQSFISQYYMTLIQNSVVDRLKQFVGHSVDTRFFDYQDRFVILDSHQLMADTLGCNIRSIHRSLKTLQKEGYLDLDAGKISINSIQLQKCQLFV